MKHSLIRQTIIETASDLFYQNGYSLTGINEIIKEAGIAKATLYSDFRSKDDICIAYLRYKNETFLEMIQTYVAKKPKGKEQLLAIFDFLKQFFNGDEFNGCWCLNTVSAIPQDNESVRSEIQNQKSDFIKLIEQLVANNIQNKTKAENRKVARKIYVLYEGAIAESHLHQAAWPITSAKEVCALILD